MVYYQKSLNDVVFHTHDKMMKNITDTSTWVSFKQTVVQYTYVI